MNAFNIEVMDKEVSRCGVGFGFFGRTQTSGSGSDVCLNVYHKRTDEQKYVLNIYVLSMNVLINIILNTSMGNRRLFSTHVCCSAQQLE